MYMIIGMGVIFALIGFIVTEKNASSLLAGYNTMSPEEQSKFPIRSYLKLFRGFHLFLGISIILVGAIIQNIFGDAMAVVFIALYPLLAYVYLVMKTQKFNASKSKSCSLLGFFVLFGCILFVSFILWPGFRPIDIRITENGIEADGIYGRQWMESDIQSIRLVDTLPPIRSKENAYSMGAISKGHFMTKKGKRIRLLVNEVSNHYLLIEDRDGEATYLANKNTDERQLFDVIRLKWPSLIE